MSAKEKTNRYHPLPIIKPEARLTPDGSQPTCSLQCQVLNVQQILTKVRLKCSPPRSTANPMRQSTYTAELEGLKEQITALQNERSKLKKELQRSKTSSENEFMRLHREANQKAAYDQLLNRYTEMQKAYKQLQLHCEDLEQQIKKYEQPVQATMTFNPLRIQQQLIDLRNENANLLLEIANRDTQLRSAANQIRSARQDSTKTKMSEDKRKVHIQPFDLKKEQKLSLDLVRLNEEGNKLKADNVRIVQQLQVARAQQQKLSEQNMKLRNQMIILRGSMGVIDKQSLQRTIKDLTYDLTYERSKCIRMEDQMNKMAEERKQLLKKIHQDRQERLSSVFQQKSSPDRSLEMSKMRQELQYYHTSKLSQQALLRRLEEENRRLRGESEDCGRRTLDMSIREMRQASESMNNELTLKNQILSAEKQELQKKYQCQQFQLTKLYEVLQTRREQLEMCYKTIQSLRRNTLQQPKDQLSQLLKTRRQHIF